MMGSCGVCACVRAATHMALIPAGQKELVGQEIPHPSLLHLFLQRLQEVGKPLEGVCFPTEPVEVNLQPGSARRSNKQRAFTLQLVCPTPTQTQPSPAFKRAATFLVRRFGSESLNLYQMDLRMEANGVTPMPAPTNMLTS